MRYTWKEFLFKKNPEGEREDSFAIGQEELKAKPESFPVLVAQRTVGGLVYQLRATNEWGGKQSVTMALFLGSQQVGELEGYADGDHPFTSLFLANEARGKALGGWIQQLWYERADIPAGGFSLEGEASCKRTWQRMVRKAMAQGFYSKQIRKGTMTLTQVKAILADRS